MNLDTALNRGLKSELTEEAALLADLITVIKARFVEAADTMLHMSVKNVRPSAERTYWPESSLTASSDDARARHIPSAAAISRAEEVLYGWMTEYVKSDDRRILLGRWSICLAAPHIAGSFRDYCQKDGLIRRTAERHVYSEFKSISSALLKFSQSLRQPDWSRVSPMMPNSGIDLGKVGTRAEKRPSHWLPDESRPIHDPNSPELEELAERIERGNRRRAAMMKQAA